MFQELKWCRVWPR